MNEDWLACITFGCGLITFVVGPTSIVGATMEGDGRRAIKYLGTYWLLNMLVMCWAYNKLVAIGAIL